MFNGSAVYRIERGEFRVDETGYLILNERQPYEIEIDSLTRVESFIVYFPVGWVNDVWHCVLEAEEQLLDDPFTPRCGVHFFERFTPQDAVLSPALARLRAEHKEGLISNLAMEERLHDLLQRMLRAQRNCRRDMDNLGALRAGTRAELWRRLNRAHDCIRVRFAEDLSVADMAAVACLSPFHFLRAFKAAFGVTPHQFLTSCRIEKAKFLLERTTVPVTQVCLEIGFESLGTFSSSFRRLTGLSPRQWRAKKQDRRSF